MGGQMMPFIGPLGAHEAALLAGTAYTTGRALGEAFRASRAMFHQPTLAKSLTEIPRDNSAKRRRLADKDPTDDTYTENIESPNTGQVNTHEMTQVSFRNGRVYCPFVTKIMAVDSGINTIQITAGRDPGGITQGYWPRSMLAYFVVSDGNLNGTQVINRIVPFNHLFVWVTSGDAAVKIWWDVVSMTPHEYWSIVMNDYDFDPDDTHIFHPGILSNINSKELLGWTGRTG